MISFCCLIIHPKCFSIRTYEDLCHHFRQVWIIPVYIYYPVSRALLSKVWFVGQQCCLIRKLVRNVESCLLAWNLQFNVISRWLCHSNVWWAPVECSLPRKTFQCFNCKQHCDEHMFNSHFSGGLCIMHLSWLSWQRAFNAFRWLVFYNSLPFSGLVGKGLTSFESF